MQETRVQSLGQEDPLEKEVATHSSILAWKIPWTEQPGRLQSMGSQRVRHDLVTKQQQQQQIIMAEYIAVYSSCSKIQTWIVSCLLGQYSLNILQIGARGYSLDLTGIEDHSDRGLSPLTRLQSSCPLTAQTSRPLHPGTSLLETSSSDSCLLKPNRASL